MASQQGFFDDEPAPPSGGRSGRGARTQPLADRLRPKTLDEVIGQDHLLAPDKPIGRMVAQGRLASMILWGPPGCGKTTIARLLAQATDLVFEPLSAVFSGVADLRRVFDAARKRQATGGGTLLFVDEIHRFNRAQQDGFLPYVEDGTVVLIGATTENPSFELNAALLSRAQVMVLARLSADALEQLLARAEAVAGRALPLLPAARAALIGMADGDGRFVLNLAQEIFALDAPAPLDPARLAELVQRRAPLYDKSQEGHYNLISALHKSVRGSDPDASLYWLARMLDGGEDPRYIARRVTRMAVEDIGLADPQALTIALAAWETYERLGSPEGELALAEAVLYMATAPKSNASYKAFGAAQRAAKESGSLMPPKHILNAPTRLMKDLGYGSGYAYDHDQEDAFSGQNYFPDEMPRQDFYRPTGRGFERILGERLAEWKRRREIRRVMTGVQLVEIAADDADTRLDRWFRRRFPDIGHVRLQKLLRSGQIRIDGKRAEASDRLAAGQTVRVPPLGPAEGAPARKREVGARDAADLRGRVLFQDDWVIVIDKPAGLAVQGGSGTTRHLDAMLDALAFDGERPRLVHRLDRDTSGVLVLARTVQAARRLAESFRGKTARKYYWAATVGVPEQPRGRIDAALAKQEGPRGERVVRDDDDGKQAVSLYAVVDHAWKSAAWVALWPLTGRTHQLRVHMAAIGTPILGDLKYGGAAAQIPGGEVGEGLHLHARRLMLPHPSGRGRIDVSAPLPPHMRETWRTFGFSAREDGDPFAEIAT